MELYVGPLSSRTTSSDLERFFKGFENKAHFSIMKLIRSSGTHYFGLVDFESERLARKAMKKLHSSKFNEHRVIVREYEHRASSNDRRALNWRELSWTRADRRDIERRQKSRLGRNVEPEFDAYDNFAVKHF
jgi:RNA recognition motif-containing protein